MFAIAHSAAVHIPLALSVLFPVAHGARLILVKKQFVPEKTWLLHWALCAMQLICCVLAYATGQRDQLLSAAPTDLINTHRLLAQEFCALWFFIFLIFPAIHWIKSHKIFLVYHVSLIALLVGQLVIAIKLGHLGGRLIFG